MEPVSLWAAVEFTACNGSTEALLTAAARAGLHPYGVTALPGGFGGRCAAWQYPRLAALARKHRVRLRIRRKLGLYFRLRPLLRRAGLWAGVTVFVAADALCTAVRLVVRTPPSLHHRPTTSRGRRAVRRRTDGPSRRRPAVGVRRYGPERTNRTGPGPGVPGTRFRLPLPDRRSGNGSVPVSGPGNGPYR